MTGRTAKAISPGTDIKDVVKLNISQLLGKKRSACLREKLHELFPYIGTDEQVATHIADRLVEMDLIVSILKMLKPVRACLYDLYDQGLPLRNLKTTWDEYVTILGWLVLTGVNDEWVEKITKALTNGKTVLDFSVAVKTEPGLEITASRLYTSPASFILDEKHDVLAPWRIPADKWDIESGWSLGYRYELFLGLLWRQLNPLPSGKDVPFKGEELLEDLRQTLISRREMDENQYIVVNLPERECCFLDEVLCRKLAEDLEGHLDIFFLDSENGESMVLVTEFRLQAQIREFLRIWKEIEEKFND